MIFIFFHKKQNQVESNVTIERLQQEVGQTQQALDLLKKDAQSPDKQQKTEAMQTQISMLKGKLTEALQKETDEAKKQQISDLQKQLETTSLELASLAQAVSTNSNQSSQNPDQTDKGFLDENGNKTNKNGVGYKLREITEYRHFGRPPYYSQLAKQEKQGGD